MYVMKAQPKSKQSSDNDRLAPLRWVILASILVLGLLPTITGPLALLVYLLPSIFVFMHGSRFLGRKNILIFFAITYIVTFTAEYLGVNTGHIFGAYYYNSIGNGPMIGGVPILLMLTYFSLAYGSYLVVRIILGWLNIVKGWNILSISLISGMIMTLSDLANDPINSTIDQVYIWTKGGIFFGVPYQNFTGWLGETFLLFLILSIIFAYITKSPKLKSVPSRRFLIEPVVLFSAPVLTVILSPIWSTKPAYIIQPMSLIALFGLGTVVLFAIVRVVGLKHKI
ncbi:MAG: hypothetical protein QG675_504 [Patescibacteria group bacterium]|jgi:putative membrane protein|nr:hypothetical protein [Patescibacteria group bacterium]